MRLTIIISLSLLLFSSVGYGQSQDVFYLHFPCDCDVLDMNETANCMVIEELEDAFKQAHSCDTLAIDVVYIESTSSPEGEYEYNTALANRRAETALNLLDHISSTPPDSLVVARCEGVAWDELHQAINLSDYTFRDEVLQILDDTLISPSARQRQLRTLHNGEAYAMMARDIFPKLRRSTISIFYKPKPTKSTLTTDVVEVVEDSEACVKKEQRPLFALKTNLLFDAMTLINFEVEVPIRRRWSIAAELTFPWWVWDNHRADSRRSRIELINGVVEGRYWWGDRVARPILTGWFAGLYAGGGLYDFEHRAEGYQGEFFIASGLSGGYAHTIGRAKRLRMEYSLGVGLLRTRYRHYEAEFCENEVWHAVETHRGVYSWFGPTRAKISLSWLLNYKRRVNRN